MRTYRELPEQELRTRHGIATVVPERALLDHLRAVGDSIEAVVGMDMALAARITARPASTGATSPRTRHSGRRAWRSCA